MTIKIDFLRSGVNGKDFPSPDMPEVALVGRSNAGKSSFLNALAKRKVARVSSAPGKTRLLNFFSAGDHYRLVDMPGYGFAARSANEIKSWQQMIERYLEERSCLVGLVLIMDVRRDWSEDEAQIQHLSNDINLPLIVVLNKSDKVRRGEQSRRLRNMEKIVGKEHVFLISSLKGSGLSLVEEFIFEHWIRGWSDLK